MRRDQPGGGTAVGDDGDDDGALLDQEIAEELWQADLARDRAWFGRGLVVLGGSGLAAAFTLAVDKYRILADPSYEPSCDVNPVLSCGSVMVTDQAEALGFPNPLIGVAAFAVVVAVGVLLAARVPLPGWVVGGLALGAVAGTAFVHWLAFQSLYRIGALCPWCVVVWAVTIPIFVWSALITLRQPRRSGAVEGLWSARYLLLLGWYLVFVVAILERFWDYWRTLV